MRMMHVMLAALLTVGALAQTSPPNASNVAIQVTQITMPVFTLNPDPATGAALGLVGNPGPRTDYYWIVANYLVGKANVAGPYIITYAPNTRSSSNYVTINPTLPPTALSYDVLRTINPVQPSGTCTCAVATAVTPGTVTNDQTGTLSSYTVNPINIGMLGMTLTNEVQGSGSSHLILRQNGQLVCDLSQGCGSSGGGANPILENCSADQTGNSFPQVVSLTNWFNAHWEFIFNTTTYIDCEVYVSTAATGATLVIDVFSADSTAGHTATIQTCDGIITTGSLNVGTLSCAGSQTFATTGTAYQRVSLTFSVQSTLVNNGILVVKIGTSPTGTAPTSDLIIYPHFIL